MDDRRDLFLIIIQNIPMHTLYVRVFSSAVNTMQLNLRSSIVKRLQELSISFHDKYQSGKLQTKVLRDVETLEYCRASYEFRAARDSHDRLCVFIYGV